MIIDEIVSKNYIRAKKLLEEKLEEFVDIRLNEYKKELAASTFLNEATRIKIVKVRIRNGKVQRRKKVSTVKGYTMRGGTLTRMSPTERRRRKFGQRAGARKRRAKMSIAVVKRKRSIRRRRAYGG
jgi:hypothetical protein